MEQNMEQNIIYENGPFYAYRVGRDTIEIRKNGTVAADLIGTVTTIERARRFIDRAARYPDNF